LWKRYNYRDYGIIGESYFDVDFDEVLYLTDTGRRWDGDAFNVRDKVETGKEEKNVGTLERVNVRTWEREKGNTLERGNVRTFKRDRAFRHTWDVIEAAEKGLLPYKIMMNVHPQRWNDALQWKGPSETLLRRMPSACFTG